MKRLSEPTASMQPLGMVGRRDVEARDVALVDRLEQELDAGVGEARRRVLQVRDQRRLQRGGVHARRRDAGEAVDLRAAERLPVADRGRDRGAELVDPVGQAADAALAARPVAGRQVEQRLREAVRRQRLGDDLGRVLVGAHVLDRREAVGGGRGEAVEEGVLLVEEGEVGGELRHRSFLRTARANLRRFPGRRAGAAYPGRLDFRPGIADLPRKRHPKERPMAFDILVKGGTLPDGTAADIGIVGETIAAVGRLGEAEAGASSTPPATSWRRPSSTRTSTWTRRSPTACRGSTPPARSSRASPCGASCARSRPSRNRRPGARLLRLGGLRWASSPSAATSTPATRG